MREKERMRAFWREEGGRTPVSVGSREGIDFSEGKDPAGRQLSAVSSMYIYCFTSLWGRGNIGTAETS